jgi:hypothetical protein
MLVEIPDGVAALRRDYANFPLRKPDPAVQRPGLERGWLLQYLLACDEITWRRWEYWYALASQPDGEHALPPNPIPKIEFLGEGGSSTAEVLALPAGPRDLDGPNDLPRERRVARVARHGGGWSKTRKLWEHVFSQVADAWQGWSSSTYIDYVLDWLLFGFGYTEEAPREPRGCEGASDRLYQAFDLGPMLLWPYDYLGDLFAEMSLGKHAGFYPTPHNLVQMMVEMAFGGGNGEDQRIATTCDPCMGTGRMLLLASNYTLNLAGMDINPIMWKATLVNGYLYAPWMVRPIQWAWDLAGRPHGAMVDVPGEEEPQLALPGVALSRRARKQVEKGQAVLI